MKTTRISSASVIVCLLGVTPGSQLGRAAAATIQIRMQISPLKGAKVSLPAAIGGAAGMGIKSLPMRPSVAARAPISSPLNRPQAAARQNEAAPKAALQGLLRELPDFGRMNLDQAKTGADQDFLSRMGRLRMVSRAKVSVPAKAARRVPRLLKRKLAVSEAVAESDEPSIKSENESPDYYPRPSSSFADPDGGAQGLDDLGNPTRGRDDNGPDSVPDEFGGNSENGSDLF